MPNRENTSSAMPPEGNGPRIVRAPRGTTISCKGWQQEAALRMIQFFFLCLQGPLAFQQILRFLLQHAVHGIIRAGSHAFLGILDQLGCYAFK